MAGFEITIHDLIYKSNGKFRANQISENLQKSWTNILLQHRK
jgi:hypothetical protein